LNGRGSLENRTTPLKKAVNGGFLSRKVFQEVRGFSKKNL